ncbi:hypothetical protein O181_066073 [Austropuccinia psidii MF-1]|uniref:Integrase zinc-binding domain-containing protein n=1 Tax=Austropuccinia psidii MF-1 TaxID=1389203 RepID=A0A9Q3I384_9BASI|nr:hypothetical protein [Austropuccinia psidii MF-1]
MTQERIEAYEKIMKDFTEAPIVLMPDCNIPFKLYIDACGNELWEALHQVQIIYDKPTEGPACYISRQIKATDGIIYHRTKNSCVITLCRRSLINTILHEFHDSINSGNLSEDRTLEKVKNCAWWQSWRKETI